MGCTLTGSQSGDMELHLDEARKQASKMARLLCEACSTIVLEVDANIEDLFSDELLEWYKEHQKIDKKRNKEEQARKNREKVIAKALKKLSSAEKEALGL